MSDPCSTESKGMRYGLTCGFWTNDPEELDRHVLKFHRDDESVYDVCGDQCDV